MTYGFAAGKKVFLVAYHRVFSLLLSVSPLHVAVVPAEDEVACDHPGHEAGDGEDGEHVDHVEQSGGRDHGVVVAVVVEQVALKRVSIEIETRQLNRKGKHERLSGNDSQETTNKET